MRNNIDIPEIVTKSELMDIIDNNLPVTMRADFKKMMEDVSVSKQRRDKVILKIKEIVEEHYDGETW